MEAVSRCGRFTSVTALKPKHAAMRVHARGAAPLPSVRSAPQTLVGVLYVALTLLSSCVYLSVLKPAFLNDLWWSGYNVSGHQALLIDLFNIQLTTRANGTFDLLAPEAVADKCYIESASTTDVYPTYVRRLAWIELTTVHYAVVNLRSLSAYWSMLMSTQFCWVDLHHEFQVAHTAARQQRCADRYIHNGAVYFETMLRNLDWADFEQNYGGDGGMFTVAVQTWLEQVPSGLEWLTTTSNARQLTSVIDEIAYWTTNNITSYEMQWTNFWQMGMSEAITIVNALGMQQDLVIKNVPRTLESSSSLVMYWIPMNDLIIMQTRNRSLVRSANNSIQMPPYLDMEGILGLADANGDYFDQTQSFRSTVGPFNSVDTFYVPVPKPVLDLYDVFQRSLFASLDNQPSLYRVINSIENINLSPTPPAWMDPQFQFYGGNPMCLLGEPLPFVQESFNFYDNCARQLPLTMSISKYSSIFAILASSMQGDMCNALQVENNLLCVEYLDSVISLAKQLVHVSNAILPLIQPASFSIQTISVGIMQYATYGPILSSNWSLLHEPLLTDEVWSFYGWVLTFDWVEGKREVVSFEGDEASLVLISSTDTPALFPSSFNTVRTATQYIYYLMVYVTSILVIVAILCLVAGILFRSKVHYANLCWFNRIVGSVWIGRPLLFVRGVTAILVLSASQLEPVNDMAHSRFKIVPRFWLTTLIVAGEATWVLYVVQDFFTVVTHSFTGLYGPIGCVLAWVSLIISNLVWPVQPVAKLNRICTSQTMGQDVACTSGQLNIGSFERIEANFIILAVALGMSICISWRCQPVRKTGSNYNRHLLGVADAFLASPDTTVGQRLWSMDRISCIMAGLVPIRWRRQYYTFDIKLWVFDVDTHSSSKCSTFTRHSRSLVQQVSIIGSHHLPRHIRTPKKGLHTAQHALWVVLGGAYAVAAITSSFTYLQVSKLNLTNDLFWDSFNMTGANTFIANWFNRQLVLNANTSSFLMTAEWISQDGAFDQSTASVFSAANYGAAMQYLELNSIDAAILGLRDTDSCSIPWLFTQYCFVDFDQQWEMANSKARQQRCQFKVPNGAVFLASILRNINFYDFYSCWGAAFDVAIANELRVSQAGRMWLSNTTKTSKPSVQDEYALWVSYGIERFDTQWQNFKHIGLANTYSVTNMFGVTYPFTLQQKHTAFRFDKETSLKMYWGIANDLVATTQNSSGLAGQSLVRSSAAFAFANTTPVAMLLQNGTLVAPLDNAFVLTQSMLGPYGSVDMHVVGCPLAARTAVRVILASLRQTLAKANDTQSVYSQINVAPTQLLPAPKAWTDIGFKAVGGSPLCQQYTFGAASSISLGMAPFASFETVCFTSSAWTTLVPTLETTIASVILANMSEATTSVITATCAQNAAFSTYCEQYLTQATSFVSTFMTHDTVAFQTLLILAAEATHAIQALDIELTQFGMLNETSPLEFYRLNVLDPTQVEFTFFAWLFLVDWTLGFREVIAFEGDASTMVLLSELIMPLIQQVNMSEYQVNLSNYLRCTVMYVTYAMIGLAILALVYFIICAGQVQAYNLLLLERVGAIVWIGRPLLFVRSLTALGLLSTSRLELHFTGYLSYFQAETPPLLNTLLAANEVTWMVAIVNDIAMVATREYSLKYAGWDSLVVSLVTAAISVIAPMSHATTLHKQCAIAQIDFHVVCTSGVVTIGHTSRFFTLILIVVGANVLFYIGTRLRQRVSKPQSTTTSMFVYGGAKYLFWKSSWTVGGVYYMDRMSALINGILTLRLRKTLVCLDIKLWRTFHVDLHDVSPTMSGSIHNATKARFLNALPIPLLGTPQAVETICIGPLE
ncbi:Aste57867_2427 [Aphanomyces stellatus]|uniref:Aste57867_2427 protein n=1 Tax=Aphanomyces stellatus TaxID=120398 RepID=A0A485KBT7_9STRA|nr:hypothetical protein As57867_002421 [Aphanomyces stellatus]VFT79628.1 Aste57867_2427 [Aphanomyces stellatus]